MSNGALVRRWGGLNRHADGSLRAMALRSVGPVKAVEFSPLDGWIGVERECGRWRQYRHTLKRTNRLWKLIERWKFSQTHHCIVRMERGQS